MPVEEHRRVALFRAAADSWGQEVAETMFELVAPSGHELATRADIGMLVDMIEAMDERWDARFVAMDEKWTHQLAAMDEKWTHQLAALDDKLTNQLAAMDDKWTRQLASMNEKWTEQHAAMDDKWTRQLASMDENWVQRQDASEQRLTVSFERGIREAITAQTRTLVLSQLGALVVLAGLAFGLSG
jgi:hypothetical protein